MDIKQFDIWMADLNPARGTEPGKVRPVTIIQTDLLNGVHPSTLVCPLTTNIHPEADILRIHLKRSQTEQLSDVLVDQIRAIDNKRLVKKIGQLTKQQSEKLKINLKIVLDI